MSKELFFEMQEKRMNELYPSTFSKKDAINEASKFVKNTLENGNVSIYELFANIVKHKAIIDTIETELRKNLPREKNEIFGVSFTPVEGGVVVNYSECEIYNQLKADLDARVELLKLAQKQECFDAYGNKVPKLGTTPRKSSITIKF